ncbi:MAG: hypothetical protein ACTHM5_17525 [Ginsengibacter sp.]
MLQNTKAKKKMDAIATEMANYFDKSITPYDLSKWISTSNANCMEFGYSLSEAGDPLDAVHFLNEIGIYILSELIDTYKGESERIEILKEQLIFIFENNGYTGTKAILADIGINYMEYYVKYPLYQEDWPKEEFLKVFDCFLTLVQMFSVYEDINLKEIRKEIGKSPYLTSQKAKSNTDIIFPALLPLRKERCRPECPPRSAVRKIRQQLASLY